MGLKIDENFKMPRKMFSVMEMPHFTYFCLVLKIKEN